MTRRKAALTLGAVAMSARASDYREVSFDATDGGKVFANLYGTGDHAVVLAHGAVFDKESWSAQAERLASEGLQVLAIDFRGYGKSKGGNGGGLWSDVLGAVRYLKRAGAKRMSVVGGSMGGGAAAEAAVRSDPGEIDRLILLAHSPIQNPEKLKGRKLFIVSEGDSVASVRSQHNAAPEPKKLVILPGSAHAQHIFKTPQSEMLIKAIIDWLTT